VSTPENEQFHLNLSASSAGKNYLLPIAIGVAVAAIILIVLTMTTDLASRILPMDESYLQVMIPPAPDGAESLSLTMLDHEIIDNTITVRGSVMNRTEYPISDLRAVIDVQDTTGRFGQTLEMPLDPGDLAPQGTAMFQTTVTLQQKPAGYSIKFRFEDGPFVPHRDERPATYGITGN
jgi:hypothetical protein